MAAKDGDPAILGFGLARLDDDELPSLTQTGDLFGTRAYMPPEQIARQRIVLDTGRFPVPMVRPPVKVSTRR